MDDEQRTLFSTRLRCLRKKNGLSQKTLAEKLNYGYTAISNYESGRNQPSIEDLIRLAKIFGVSVDFLIGNDSEKTLEDEIKIFYEDGIKNFINLYHNQEELREDMEAIVNGIMNLYWKADRQEM